MSSFADAVRDLRLAARGLRRTPGFAAIAVLTIVAGIGWLAFLSPTLGYAVFNVVALIALIGSIAMIGWLLVKGVDEERWRALATTSARLP